MRDIYLVTDGSHGTECALDEPIAPLGGVVSNDISKLTQLIQVFRAPTLADLGDDTQEANEDQTEKPHSDRRPPRQWRWKSCLIGNHGKPRLAHDTGHDS